MRLRDTVIAELLTRFKLACDVTFAAVAPLRVDPFVIVAEAALHILFIL